MTKLEAIATAKQFRKDADELLQRMKAHRKEMCRPVAPVQDVRNGVVVGEQSGEMWGDDQVEAIAQHTLSIRDLESAIMRQGMALKYVGNPDPYPNSKNPASSVVEPTADGLKL